MIIHLDPHSGIPVYRQLMDQIRFLIASNVLSPGDEIPSTRALSAQLGVNPMTISKAFKTLEQEGVLERRPGLPLVVARRETASGRRDRVTQLRDSLRPIASKVRQLGLETDEALEVFRHVLEDEEDERP